MGADCFAFQLTFCPAQQFSGILQGKGKLLGKFLVRIIKGFLHNEHGPFLGG
jgi:hypothetical protein